MSDSADHQTQPPAWGENKAAFLARLIVGAEFRKEVGALLNRIFDAVSAKQPNGQDQVKALTMQAAALYHQAEATTALLSDDELARLLAEHDQFLEQATIDEDVQKLDTIAGQDDQFPEWVDTAPFADLIRFAEQEKREQDIRYEDRSAAAALYHFEQEGRLHGVVRMFAARFIAETAARIDEYDNAKLVLGNILK